MSSKLEFYLLILFYLKSVLIYESKAAEIMLTIKTAERSVSSQLMNMIENFKQEMPCGVPSLGIPPLAPFLVEQQDLNLQIAGINVSGEVTDLRLDGLNEFAIEQLHVTLLSNKVTFKFNWASINLTTNYNFHTDFGPIESSGLARFNLENFTVQANIRYAWQFSTGTLSLSRLDLYLSLDRVRSNIDGLSEKELLSEKLNEFIEEWIMVAVNDNTDRIVKLSNDLAMPMINQVLGTFTLSDLFNLLGSSSKPCMSPSAKPSSPNLRLNDKITEQVNLSKDDYIK